jgi:hypothetical protein
MTCWLARCLVEADGTVASSVTGKSVEFNGVLKTNLETGETIRKSHNVPEPAREAICKRLKG